jgi:hypothetical protein
MSEFSLNGDIKLDCRTHVMAYVRCHAGETLYRCDSCGREIREYHDTCSGG